MDGVGAVATATAGRVVPAPARAHTQLPISGSFSSPRINFVAPTIFPSLSASSPRSSRFVASAVVQLEPDYVSYDQNRSVFPAEACEEVGGDACNIEGIGPEVKATNSTLENKTKFTTTNAIERQYLDYSGAKTVFPGEACDELGGEFCAPEYQSGVFPEKAQAKVA